jgi:Kef-type K+ transport system membrane component KefB
MDKKSKASRLEASIMVAMVLALILGIAIKRVRLGIVLGLIIAGVIVLLSWIKSQKRD